MDNLAYIYLMASIFNFLILAFLGIEYVFISLPVLKENVIAIIFLFFGCIWLIQFFKEVAYV